MKLIPVLLVAFVVAVDAHSTMAQEIRSVPGGGELPALIQHLLESTVARQTVGPSESSTSAIRNRSIQGPTGELLPPALATKQLRGSDYFEWCLRWNRQQYLKASQRAVPATSIRGQVNRQNSFVQGTNSGGFLRSSRGNSFSVASNSVSDSREQLWRVGGYGGGPVDIYNPFVTKTER